MKTVAVILRSLDEFLLQFRDVMPNTILNAADHVVIIFIEKNKWFLFNDPHTMLESEKLLSLEQKLHRRAVVDHLEKVSSFIKRINRRIETSKLVISGDEKYKIRKCLVCLEVEAAIFIGGEEKSRFFGFLVQSLEDYVFEMMRIPVVKVPVPRTS